MMSLHKTACAASLAIALLFTTGSHAATEAVDARAGKTLHLFLSTSETGLDPAVASDLASLNLMENVFDPLLRYDYLARPVKLQGNTARGLPKVEDGGRTYIFQIQPGIFFTPDPAVRPEPEIAVAVFAGRQAGRRCGAESQVQL